MNRRRRINVGDMVIPIDDRDFLYSIPEKLESEDDPIDLIWENDTIGTVVDVQEFEPPRKYCQIKIIVGDILGWSYSDYVKVIRL